MSLELFKNEVKTVLGKFFSIDKITKIFNGLGYISKSPKVLTFHHVIDPEILPYPLEDGMYVRPATFKMLIEYLANEFEVISISELLNRLESKKEISGKTLTLTFDDAWHDNYLYAFPLLKSLKIPATIFIPTSFVNTNDLFWTDKIIILLKECQKDSLKKEEFSENEFRLINNYLLKPNGKNLEKLLDYYKYTDPSESLKLLQKLEAQFADLSSLYSPARTFLNWDEIREMSQFNITFASHSHSHADLRKIAKEDLKSDIENSLAIMNKENIQPLNVFCYPGGYYNNSTQEVLDKLGFKAAFITSGRNNLSTNPKILSRINIHDDISKTKDLFRYTIGP